MQNEFAYAVVNLHILESRRNLTSTAANLVSCGGNGWVRFWNTQHTSLAAEFVAHAHCKLDFPFFIFLFFSIQDLLEIYRAILNILRNSCIALM